MENVPDPWKPAKQGYKPKKLSAISDVWVDSNHYDKSLIWSVAVEGKKFDLILNSTTSHFALKHVVFPKDIDSKKLALKYKGDIQNYIDSKMQGRLDKRNIKSNKDLGDTETFEKKREYRLTQKFKIDGNPIPAASAINLKFPEMDGFPHRRIEEVAARVAIAQEISKHVFKNVQGKKWLFEMAVITVDFGIACVITRTREGITYAQNKMDIGFAPQNGYSNVNGGSILLIHADTAKYKPGIE